MKRTIVLPAYNEAESITSTIESVTREISHWDNCEVLVCDNASTDDTVQLVESLSKVDPRIKVLTADQNLLYAWNVGRGISHASGGRVFVLDADGQYPPTVIHDLDKLLDSGYGLVLGSRESRVGGFRRVIASYVYLFLIRLYLGFNLKDINAGAKALSPEFASKFHVKFRGTMVNPELFASAISNGFKVGEVPVGHELRIAGETSHGFNKPIKLFKEAHKYLKFLRKNYRPLKRPRLSRWF
jgi:glycosyltransferase involved in cell wall biosynthesis